jgi:glycosyltransferase involved in cell wall biosynthesis
VSAVAGAASRPVQHGPPGLRISVVVPTFRRPDLLQRCLQSLLAQQLPAGACEIIVVDDEPAEATRRLVLGLAEASPCFSLRYLRPAHGHGPAVARNTGWRAARAPLVAFTDDDTVAASDWLACGEAAMQAGHWAALGGRVQVPPLHGPGGAPTDHERMTRGLETAAFVTANAFVWRSALERVNGFDEAFARAWREDADLQFRLAAEAGPVGRCEDALVRHPVRPERWGVSLRQQKNVYFDALLYRKHPRLYREAIRRVPPWDYYLIVAASAGAAGLGLAGRPLGALLSGGLALAGILRFAARRLRGASHAPSHVLEMLLTSALIPFLSVWWRLRGAWHFRVAFL